MGIFRVPAKVRNWQNRFLPPGKQGREVSCDMLVDSPVPLNWHFPLNSWTLSSSKSWGTMRVVTADGGQRECRVLGMVELEVQGRVCQVRALELPRGTQPLLGAVPLEEMDWHIDPLGQKLVPNPLSPTGHCCIYDGRPRYASATTTAQAQRNCGSPNANLAVRRPLATRQIHAHPDCL